MVIVPRSQRRILTICSFIVSMIASMFEAICNGMARASSWGACHASANVASSTLLYQRSLHMRGERRKSDSPRILPRSMLNGRSTPLVIEELVSQGSRSTPATATPNQHIERGLGKCWRAQSKWGSLIWQNAYSRSSDVLSNQPHRPGRLTFYERSEYCSIRQFSWRHA